MSEPLTSSQPLPKEDPGHLVLRGRPRPAVRFRRGLIVAISAAVAASLITVSWLALLPAGPHRAAPIGDSEETAKTTLPDALAGTPKSYGDVPRLGPPLPGDLGRPILEHERGLDTQVTPGAGVSAAEQNGRDSAMAQSHERAREERQAARSAGLMVQLADGSPRTPAVTDADGSATPAALGTAQAAAMPGQQHKIEFARSGEGTADPHALAAASSPWTLAAGTIIPASLLTGLNSDLPGMVIAQVSENVRDSATGRTILVPQGARLIGKYDSVVAFGQRRALVVWSRIVLPDGSSIELDHMPAADSAGYTGLSDGVDSHSWQLLKAIGLSTLLGVGTQLGLGGSESDLVRAIRESAQQNAAHAGDQIVGRDLDIQPTITIRPGWPVRAMVNQDLVLRPWRGS